MKSILQDTIIVPFQFKAQGKEAQYMRPASNKMDYPCDNMVINITPGVCAFAQLELETFFTVVICQNGDKTQ